MDEHQLFLALAFSSFQRSATESCLDIISFPANQHPHRPNHLLGGKVLQRNSLGHLRLLLRRPPSHSQELREGPGSQRLE